MTLAWFLTRRCGSRQRLPNGRAARDGAAVAEAVRRGDAWYAMLERIDVGTIPTGIADDPPRAQLGVGERRGSPGFRPILDRRPGRGRCPADGLRAAYARFRLAEAMLARTRRARRRPRPRGRGHARSRSAPGLVESIEGLPRGPAAARRIAVGRVPAVPDVPDPVAAYELTASGAGSAPAGGCGPDNRQIGEELFISESTAGVHVSRILAKFGVAGRVEAATIAARLGLTD